MILWLYCKLLQWFRVLYYFGWYFDRLEERRVLLWDECRLGRYCWYWSGVSRILNKNLLIGVKMALENKASESVIVNSYVFEKEVPPLQHNPFLLQKLTHLLCPNQSSPSLRCSERPNYSLRSPQSLLSHFHASLPRSWT